MRLKVALVQIDYLLGHPQHNISKINHLLSTIKGKFPDLVVLSELAITGYNFPLSKAIRPFLESPSRYGASLNFAHELSLKHQCFTVVGYPEIAHGKDEGTGSGGEGAEDVVIYNSCAVFDQGGELVYNYRKTFLYETDEKWGCLENPQRGFVPVQLQFKPRVNPEEGNTNGINNARSSSILTNFGICMDLNPYKFEAPFNKFEFSAQCYHNKSKLIVCPMAWLSSQSPSIKTELTQEEKLQQAKQVQLPLEPCNDTINYWILRFFPFLKHKYSFMPKWWHGGGSSSTTTTSTTTSTTTNNNNEGVNVLICNRVGKEDDVVYGGSSCILQFGNDEGRRSDGCNAGSAGSAGSAGGADGDYDAIDESNPSVDVIGRLSQSEEGILVKEIDV